MLTLTTLGESLHRRHPTSLPASRSGFPRRTASRRAPAASVLLLLALCPGSAARGQTPAPAASTPTATLRPTLNSIGETVAGLNVSHWKAPGEVRTVSQRDIDSIHRDLSATLPPLLDAADAQPPSVASIFAVYRNIDALYDVLLRLSETATLAGPQSDALSLQQAQVSLEAARRDLGDAILQLAASHERELASLRAAAQAAAAAAAAAPPPPPTTTVIDDGPAPATKPAPAVRRKKKPVTPPPAAPATPPQ